MDINTKIPVASVIRRWPGGDAICTLYWDVRLSKFTNIYEEIICHRYHRVVIPDANIVAWLDHYIRDQDTLQPDSYLIASPPTPEWAAILNTIVDEKKRSVKLLLRRLGVPPQKDMK